MPISADKLLTTKLEELQGYIPLKINSLLPSRVVAVRSRMHMDQCKSAVDTFTFYLIVTGISASAASVDVFEMLIT